MFTDTHAHLNDLRLIDSDAIKNSLDAKVDLIINAGYDLKSSKIGAELAEKHRQIYFAAGIHPSDASTFNLNDLNLLDEYLANEKCVALGEIGLDYHYDGFDKNKQITLFMAQLEIAKQQNLPVIIHSRNCTKDLLDIIENNQNYFENCVMHCFSGSAQTAKILTDKGIYISFAGTLTFKNAPRLVEAAKVVPLDLVLTETDCPYLSPEPFRGQTNQPANVVYVAKKLAEIKEIPLETLALAVRKNTIKLFNKIKMVNN